MLDAIHKKPVLRTTPPAQPIPCMRCQYGIMDVPVEGKMNCFKEGPGKTKSFIREEVEQMTFCDRMVGWAKMELNDLGEKDQTELKKAERILKNR